MIRNTLTFLVRDALIREGADPEGFSVTHTERREHGDYATNAAMVAAKKAGISPRTLAEGIKAHLDLGKHAMIKEVSIAGPGFINITLTEDALADEMERLREELPRGVEREKKERINIEFISANPTGDLHIGHGRGAFFGDVLARVLAYAGAEVTREFYINDSRESKQIKELGKTARGEGEQYKTERLMQLLARVDVSGKSESDAGFLLAEMVGAYNRAFIESKLGINFDIWYSEDARIRATGAADNMLALLKEKNLLHEKDGAVWLKTSEYDDGEDQVVVRSDGSKSYFIADIFYHNEKFARGFTKAIDVWGADHHGHVKRMHAAGKMLGWPEGVPHIFITQMVALKEDGESKKMSKRAGNVILLEDLVDELGIDVVRWFFLEKSLSSHMEFDMALARERSAKNPVFYVQYAHARIASIVRNAAGAVEKSDGSLTELLANLSARALAGKIATFPEVVSDIAQNYEVQRLPTYTYELASLFSQFYRDVRVIDEGKVNAAALALVSLTKDTLAQTLALLGISAPEKMEKEKE